MAMKFSTYDAFQSFTKGHLIDEEILDHATDFICLNLRRNYDSLTWSAFYTYVSYCRIVLSFKKENNQPPMVRIGDTICKGQIVNFIRNEKHSYPNCTCGSTYMQCHPIKSKKKITKE